MPPAAARDSGFQRTPANDAFAFIGATAFSNAAGQLRAFEQSAGNWIVEADVNGDGAADMVIAVSSTVPIGVDAFAL